MKEPLPAPATPHDMVIEFDRIDADSLSLVGGKAANLGVLARAGFPVPQGFCLTTSVYRAVAGTAGLDEVLHALTTADPASVPPLAGRARDLVLGAPVPTAVSAAIRIGYARIGDDAAAVAVRSSATAEDLPFASFAGQQDTFLNVVGTDAVEDAVRHCWASLWTDRAVAYRQANGIDHREVALAVVVQRMVDPSVAGVLFTANPLTGRRHETVIDASPGLGEAVVSGAVNPDHFVVDTVTGEVRERRIGDKRVRIRALPGGGTERVEDERVEETARACLDDAQLIALVAIGSQVEEHYGEPQDIEWAIDRDGALWLLQARPITTLYPVPHRRHPAPGTRLFLCFTLAQGLTRPITPMGLAAFRLIGSSIATTAGFALADPLNGPPPYAEAGGRFFIDLTPAIRSTVGRAIAPRVFDVMEARSAAVMRRLFDDPRFSVILRQKRPLIKHVARVAIRARAPITALQAVLSPAAALRHADRALIRLRHVVEVPDDASPSQRLDHVKRVLGRDLFPIVPTILPLPLVGFATLFLARKVIGDRATHDEWQSILRGLPNNVTTEMDLAMWGVAIGIGGDPESEAAFTTEDLPGLVARYRAGSLPAVAQTALAEFLNRHGDRAVAEIDVGMPRWSEDPTHVIGVLTNYLRLTGQDLAPDQQFAGAAKQARAAVAVLVAKARADGRVRGLIVRMALRRTRALAGLRELPKYFFVVAIAAMRRELLQVGEALTTAGSIAAPADIFFLDLAEAETGLTGEDFRQRVYDRRLVYERELLRRHIPRVLLSDGTEPEAQRGEQPAGEQGVPAGTLNGTPASAGVVTGPARVILDPVGAHLEPGDILVAPSTDPGWTPLFLTAGGLVMEMGGANSHGAVVAREYGIPAVVGVPDATTRLLTGRRISVDGAAGTVTPL
jgi:pyruvate,water dikinase